MSNRPYLNTSCRSNIVKSPPNPGIAHTAGGGGGGVTGGIDKCKQYDRLGMRPMRPHCVKYVVSCEGAIGKGCAGQCSGHSECSLRLYGGPYLL